MTYAIVGPGGQIPGAPAGNLARFLELLLGFAEELVVNKITRVARIPLHDLLVITTGPFCSRC